MIEQIDRSTVKRTNTAIINVRRVATLARRQRIEEAVKLAESVVSTLNVFRQYCYAVLADIQYEDVLSRFITNQLTYAAFVEAGENLNDLAALLPVKNRKPMKEEYGQVHLLIEDVKDYIENFKKGAVNNGTK